MDHTFGSEINKTRPCVIISPAEMNRHLSAFVRSTFNPHAQGLPNKGFLNINGQKSVVILDQIRTIDKSRLGSLFGKLNAKEIIEIKTVLKEMFLQ